MLGLTDVPIVLAPTTAYLMLGGRCLMNCAFCAQARESLSDDLYLSRVIWPEYPLCTVVDRLAGAVARGAIRRTCVQVTVTQEAFDQTLAVVRAVKAKSDVPFDVAILPHDLNQVGQLIAAGVDHIGFGLDAACERVFRQVKGGSWSRSTDLIERAAHSFPGKVAVHLIVGLGETEQEMVERMQWACDLGVTVGLFAFTPVRGTHLEDMAPPPLATYRRMQVVRWLITQRQARSEQVSFDRQGRLVSLGVPLPKAGTPFQTSGCPDCNRPYYNERPGGVMYNYARPLTELEVAQALTETELAD